MHRECDGAVEGKGRGGEQECYTIILLAIEHVYIIIAPNLRWRIAVSVEEREQGHF